MYIGVCYDQLINFYYDNYFVTFGRKQKKLNWDMNLWMFAIQQLDLAHFLLIEQIEYRWYDFLKFNLIVAIYQNVTFQAKTKAGRQFPAYVGLPVM